MSTVTTRIESILTSEYSIENFVELSKEIFDNLQIVAPNKFNKEFSNFSSHIAGYSHIGNYVTPDDDKIVVLAVQLQNSRFVENARSTQRSFAKKVIENTNSEAAFIAFYTEGEPKWRMSFVRLDYEAKIENGKLKTVENLTPAKRYSYLVGKDEPCHTAIDSLRKFIIDHNYHPTLDEFEEAFSVERVTNAFFELYKEKFYQLCEHLEANEDFVIESAQHNFTSAQFAKKLMGQIVFLYFLQKKGWLGVNAWPKSLTAKEYKNAFYARGAKSRELIPTVYKQVSEDEYVLSGAGINALSNEDEAVLASCVKGMPWGTGPHNFMRKLFDVAVNRKQNYFDDVLEPLFYRALNVNRGEQGYCPELHCRMPFLSGGLFEPIDGYDWEHNNFAIPNKIFSNKDEKGERDADGILDIFDRYNFTMSEDEPMEREVAIDPEMLGKVFENLLEVKDRKSKGAFYTPREIVHYMCQESLINYLVRTMNVDEDAIRDFILYGDILKDMDTSKDKREGSNEMLISEQLYKIDSSGNIVVNRLKEMDEALKNVRVVDPAVGSGAFPLGMLNEIVRARYNITAYLCIGKNANDKRLIYSLERSMHSLKYETIRNCIFAADIEPSAVDIAQLRLWLSLVIDDEINPNADSPLDGHKNPLPLPNLECNILCGNSLIDEFEGIKLINESDIIGTADKDEQQLNFGMGKFDTLLTHLIEKQDELFRCDETNKKKALLSEIASIRDAVIESQLDGCSNEQKQKYYDTKSLASKPYVLWQLDFARVFREKKGFDIVIGNPPYVQLQKTIDDEGTKLGDLYEAMNFQTFAKTGDIYCLFYEKGFNLLKQNGSLTFITSNKWMRAAYGKELRSFLSKYTNPVRLIDFAGQKIFETATVDVNILQFEKAPNEGKTYACIAQEDCRNNLSVYIEQHAALYAFNYEDGWSILSPIAISIKKAIEEKGVPLSQWNLQINYGIKTGLNEAFIISSQQKDALIAEDPKSAEVIRPILRGRDIKRYEANFQNLYLISTFPSKHYSIDDFPAIKKHLLQFGMERLEQTGKKHLVNGECIKSRKKTSNKWFETQDSISYWDDFSKQKIIYPETTQGAYFYLDDGEYYLDKTCFFMISDVPHYLIATLSSKLFEYAYKRIFSSIELGANGYQYNKHALIKLPVIPATAVSNAIMEDIVDTVDKIFKVDDETAKEQLSVHIDDIVYNLYEINDDEQLYITNALSQGL